METAIIADDRALPEAEVPSGCEEYTVALRFRADGVYLWCPYETLTMAGSWHSHEVDTEAAHYGDSKNMVLDGPSYTELRVCIKKREEECCTDRRRSMNLHRH